MRKEYDFSKGEKKDAGRTNESVVPVPNATPLLPKDWYELLQDVAETYDQHFLTEEEIEAGNHMATADDLCAFAEYILPILEQQPKPDK